MEIIFIGVNPKIKFAVHANVNVYDGIFDLHPQTVNQFLKEPEK